MVDQFLSHAESALGQAGVLVGQPELSAAALIGALALAVNARISLLAPLLIVSAEISQLYGVEISPALLDAIPIFALLALILGAVQSVITAVAGRDAAATLIGVVIGGLVLFALWRGPARVLRLLSRGRF